MWLINVHTRELTQFNEWNRPKYTILSHTWDGAEITFQEYRNHDPKNRDDEQFRKIDGCCQQTQRDGFDFTWVDNCCIDKSSSAELSEAINSMLKWYNEAEVCYAYLCDLPRDFTACPEEPSARYVWTAQLRASKWFKRGWTLQELIAPVDVLLFSKSWTCIARRSQISSILAEITRIHESMLEWHASEVAEEPRRVRRAILGKAPSKSSEIDEPSLVILRRRLKRFSVAQRMSWASSRETSRSEDTAYCLLGIFDINMPLLYGEGSKAFIRLQEEIIRVSADQSILAWDFPPEDIFQKEHLSAPGQLLAPSPAYFIYAHDIIANPADKVRQPFNMTNRGLRIRLPVSTERAAYAQLGCVSRTFPSRLLKVYLNSVEDDSYVIVGRRSTFGRDVSKVQRVWESSAWDVALPSKDIFLLPAFVLPDEKLKLEGDFCIYGFHDRPAYSATLVRPSDPWNFVTQPRDDPWATEWVARAKPGQVDLCDRARLRFQRCESHSVEQAYTVDFYFSFQSLSPTSWCKSISRSSPETWHPEQASISCVRIYVVEEGVPWELLPHGTIDLATTWPNSIKLELAEDFVLLVQVIRINEQLWSLHISNHLELGPEEHYPVRLPERLPERLRSAREYSKGTVFELPGSEPFMAQVPYLDMAFELPGDEVNSAET